MLARRVIGSPLHSRECGNATDADQRQSGDWLSRGDAHPATIMAWSLCTGSPRCAPGGAAGRGAWNPPTVGRIVALAEAAREFAPDEVLLVLPGVLPHKKFEHAGLRHCGWHWLIKLAAGSIEWLGVAAGPGEACLWSWRGGCGRPIARVEHDLSSCAARDAAERFLNWDYADGRGRGANNCGSSRCWWRGAAKPFVPPDSAAGGRAILWI
jgi:hypothetical protein